MEFRWELGECVFLFGGISKARFIRCFLSPVITLPHGEGYIGPPLTAIFSLLLEKPSAGLLLHPNVGALLVFGGLDTGLVGFPHVYPLVKFRGTWLLLFRGQYMELDSVYSYPVVPRLIFSIFRLL